MCIEVYKTADKIFNRSPNHSPGSTARNNLRSQVSRHEYNDSREKVVKNLNFSKEVITSQSRPNSPGRHQKPALALSHRSEANVASYPRSANRSPVHHKLEKELEKMNPFLQKKFPVKVRKGSNNAHSNSKISQNWHSEEKSSAMSSVKDRYDARNNYSTNMKVSDSKGRNEYKVGSLNGSREMKIH